MRVRNFRLAVSVTSHFVANEFQPHDTNLSFGVHLFAFLNFD
jgi:hypothetical protein